MSYKGKTRILMICLGNICRSPTAEGVLRHLLAETAPQLAVEVDSAGTGDYHIGEPPDARAQRAALRRGIDLSGLRARQVGLRDFAHFDWIFAMDRHNLHDLREMRPESSHAQLRLFLQFAADPISLKKPANLENLAQLDEVDEVDELDKLDVPDPYFGDAAGFERVLDLTTAASRGLIAALQQRS